MAIFGRKAQAPVKDYTMEDQPTNRFALFFTVLGIRFWKMIQLNLLYVLFILPAAAWIIFNILAISQFGMLEGYERTEQINAILFQFFIGNVLTMALAGPPTAGLNYVLRRWAADDHAWVWLDFKDGMFENWKMSMLVSLIMGVFLMLAYTAFGFYQSPDAGAFQFLFYFVLIFLVVGVLASIYVYPMIVSYHVTLREIYKNTIVLAIARLPFSILMVGVYFAPWILLVTDLSLVLTIFELLIGFSLTGLITNSYTNATFDKYVRANVERRTQKRRQEQ